MTKILKGTVPSIYRLANPSMALAIFVNESNLTSLARRPKITERCLNALYLFTVLIPVLQQPLPYLFPLVALDNNFTILGRTTCTAMVF